MPTVPLWFTSGPHDLFGWLDHPPDGRLRGGVVLCPPIGYELISAHDTFRQLAERLSERGFVVLRFDYPGTGDSTDPEPEEHLDRAWQDSVVSASAVLRRAGAPWIAAVGMRMGATLLASPAAQRPQADALVLWDPCPSGASFFRQQHALLRVSRYEIPADPTATTAGIAILDAVYPADQAERLSAMRITNGHPYLAEHMLVLSRQRPESHPLYEHFDGRGATWRKIDGQPDLLDISSTEAIIPDASVELVADWLADVAPQTTGPLVVNEPMRTAVELSNGEGVERSARLGDLGLFGMVSEPSRPLDGAPLMVFLNVGTEVHIGPGRLWVELSRRLVRLGFSSLRMDLSAIGDSPSRPGQARVSYSPFVLDDIRQATRALRPDDPSNVVLIGLCSGAYAALHAGQQLGVRGAVAINPVLDMDVAKVSREEMARHTGPELASPRLRYASALLKRPWMKKLLLNLPPMTWRIAHSLRIQRSPAAGLKNVVTAIDHTLVICGAQDSRPYVQRGKWIIDRLTRQGHLELCTIPMLDHSLHGEEGRHQLAEMVIDHLDRRFGGLPQPPPIGDSTLLAVD